MPRYSIVVPVYNAERYLGECLESVYGQTYGDYEVVLVDDGSTDASMEICGAYVRNRPAVPTKVVSQENRGLLAARRAGIRAASGDYVWSVDADDVICTDGLQVVDAVLEREGFDIVQFEAQRGVSPMFALPACPLLGASRTYRGAEVADFIGLYCDGKVNSLCFKVIRRELLDPANDYGEWGRLQNCEDGLQVVDALGRAESVCYLRECLYFYRQSNGGSILHRYYRGYYDELNRVLTYALGVIEGLAQRYDRDDYERRLLVSQMLLTFYDFRKSCTLRTAHEQLAEIRGNHIYKRASRYRGYLRGDVRAFYGLIDKRMYGLAALEALVHRGIWRARMAASYARHAELDVVPARRRPR